MRWLCDLVVQIHALPTWLTICTARPLFPEGHPFRASIPLAHWASHRTRLSRQFDWSLWWMILLMATVLTAGLWSPR